MSCLARDVLKWVQSLDLTFSIKNTKRDLANGFLLAEIRSKYYPLELQMHAYDTGMGPVAKRNNWELLPKGQGNEIVMNHSNAANLLGISAVLVVGAGGLGQEGVSRLSTSVATGYESAAAEFDLGKVVVLKVLCALFGITDQHVSFSRSSLAIMLCRGKLIGKFDSINSIDLDAIPKVLEKKEIFITYFATLLQSTLKEACPRILQIKEMSLLLARISSTPEKIPFIARILNAFVGPETSDAEKVRVFLHVKSIVFGSAASRAGVASGAAAVVQGGSLGSWESVLQRSSQSKVISQDGGGHPSHASQRVTLLLSDNGSLRGIASVTLTAKRWIQGQHHGLVIYWDLVFLGKQVFPRVVDTWFAFGVGMGVIRNMQTTKYVMIPKELMQILLAVSVSISIAPDLYAPSKS
ncbi:spermatogenesis-associated protein 4 [Podochytrium sp. JEL0797]|nr:spermatogenesis-associated protein 4 [Podochytrium sp. JEL0797]